jgi:hypothetical protein
MLNLETTTKLSPEDTIKRAVKFFGPGGYGLKITEESATYASFEGGGGSVQVAAFAKDKKTSVELMSREWDYQLREFVGKIK